MDLNGALKNGQVWTDRVEGRRTKGRSRNGGRCEQSDGNRNTRDVSGTLVGRNRVIKVDGWCALSEISQTEKDEDHMVSLIRGI